MEKTKRERKLEKTIHTLVGFMGEIDDARNVINNMMVNALTHIKKGQIGQATKIIEKAKKLTDKK